jgi:hypothetical protein
MADKKPTLADINARNKEFWADVKEKVDPLLSKPKLVHEALDDMRDQSRRGTGNVDSLEYAIQRVAAKESERQRSNKKGKPVKNRKRRHREIVTDAMRAALKIDPDTSCKMFLAAGEKDAWSGIEFCVVPDSNPMKYWIYCGELEPRDEEDRDKAHEASKAEIPYKTIEGWFGKAKIVA